MTTFKPTLIAGQAASGKTHDLKDITRQFIEQYPHGDCIVWAEFYDEWDDIVDQLYSINESTDAGEAYSFYRTLKSIKARDVLKRDPELATLIVIDGVNLLLYLLGDVRQISDETDYQRETEKLLNKLAEEYQDRNVFIYAANFTNSCRDLGMKFGDSFTQTTTTKMKETAHA